MPFCFSQDSGSLPWLDPELMDSMVKLKIDVLTIHAPGALHRLSYIPNLTQTSLQAGNFEQLLLISTLVFIIILNF